MIFNTSVILYFCVLCIGVIATFMNFTDAFESMGIRFKWALILSVLITTFIIFALIVNFAPFIQSFVGLL